MLNRTVILAALLTLTLGACASTKGEVTTASSKPDEAAIKLSADGKEWLDKDGKPVPPPTQQVDLSYNRMAGEITNGSVQLFSLDGPAQPVQQLSRQTTAGTGSYGMKGRPSSNDSSVTVFPFNDDTPMMPRGNTRMAGDSKTYAGDGTMLPMPGKAERMANLNALPAEVGNPNVIYFSHGSAALNGVARQAIADVAKSYGGGLVQIDGHASKRTKTKDPVKAALANLEMSMKRAMVVTRKLIAAGVPPKSIKVTAHGEREPAGPEDSHEGESKNRRVEIRTEKKK